MKFSKIMKVHVLFVVIILFWTLVLTNGFLWLEAAFGVVSNYCA